MVRVRQPIFVLNKTAEDSVDLAYRIATGLHRISEIKISTSAVEAAEFLHWGLGQQECVIVVALTEQVDITRLREKITNARYVKFVFVGNKDALATFDEVLRSSIVVEHV